jgi:hypothetical protein
MILSRLNDLRRRRDLYKKRQGYRRKIARLLREIPQPHVAVDPGEMALRRYRPRYADTRWHVAYGTLSGVPSGGYIPEDLFYTEIEPRLNHAGRAAVYRDKIDLGFLLPPDDYVGNQFFRHAGHWHDESGAPVSIQVVEKWLAGRTEAVLKPAADSGGGRGLVIGSAASIMDTVRATRHALVLQEVFAQHPDLARFNASSLNTIRLLSLRVRGEIRVVSAILRLGGAGSRVDNVSRGAIGVGVDQGALRAFGADIEFGVHERHPDSGIVFAGHPVPAWEQVRALAVRSHNRLVGTDVVSWDIAVGSDGRPRVIEANLREQEIGGPQLLNGPVFEPYLETLFEART